MQIWLSRSTFDLPIPTILASIYNKLHALVHELFGAYQHTVIGHLSQLTPIIRTVPHLTHCNDLIARRRWRSPHTREHYAHPSVTEGW